MAFREEEFGFSKSRFTLLVFKTENFYSVDAGGGGVRVCGSVKINAIDHGTIVNINSLNSQLKGLAGYN